jgi:hypothetical protein
VKAEEGSAESKNFMLKNKDGKQYIKTKWVVRHLECRGKKDVAET